MDDPYDTLAHHLLTPSAFSSGHSPNLQTWPHSAHFYTQNVPVLSPPPGGSPTLHPFPPTQLRSDGNPLSYFQPEAADHRVPMHDQGLNCHPIQTRLDRSVPSALSIGHRLTSETLPAISVSIVIRFRHGMVTHEL